MIVSSVRCCLILLLTFCAMQAYAQQKDYLDDDWGADFDLAMEPQDSSMPAETSTLISAFWERAAVRLKSDLAYQDELTIARAQAGFDAAARPFANTYLKVDLQYTYFQNQDDLVQDTDSVQHALKINDAWVQYTHQACNAKAGRQKLFWGAVEGSYALDVLMPLDLREPLLTDFSLIRSSQDMAVFTCFFPGIDLELFVTPQAVLNQDSVRKTQRAEDLEDKLDLEVGGRVTKHFAGMDIGLYLARLYENSPEAVIDFNTQRVAGYQLDQFDLVGFSVVYAIDRLLLELDFSYQEERKRVALGSSNSEDSLKYRDELALGFEYTTETNHQLSGGVWFYSYLSPIAPGQVQHAEMWNVNWSKQYWHDDLTLSTLALWQKRPDVAQLTVMADYLWDDHWSSALAVSYQAPSSAFSEAMTGFGMQQGWAFNLSLEYQF